MESEEDHEKLWKRQQFKEWVEKEASMKLNEMQGIIGQKIDYDYGIQ